MSREKTYTVHQYASTGPRLRSRGMWAADIATNADWKALQRGLGFEAEEWPPRMTPRWFFVQLQRGLGFEAEE